MHSCSFSWSRSAQAPVRCSPTHKSCYRSRHWPSYAPCSALLSSKLVKDAALKVYPGAPHGLFATHKDQFNADLLALIGA